MAIQLDPDQKQAVIGEGHQLCIAGPGSGKTRTITEKAAYLLERYPNGIVGAVTYTKSAANEIKERILERSPQSSKRVITGTFHSLASSQIRKFYPKVRIVSEGEINFFIKKIISELALDTDVEELKAKILFLKSTSNSNIKHDLTYESYKMYEELLRKHQAFDYADLIIKATEGMKEGKIRPIPFDWLMVDEYQDSDGIQYDWVQQHYLKRGTIVTVVGDDDQSIYGWRNAMGYGGMTRFINDYGPQKIFLSTNYRCGKNIVALAKQLIAFNTNRAQKEIKPFTSNPEGEFYYMIYPNRSAEVEAIGAEVRSFKDQYSIAVLARNNKQLDDVETYLQFFEIPIYRMGGESFWDSTGAIAVIDIIKIIISNSWGATSHLLNIIGVDIDNIDYLSEIFLEIPLSGWEGLIKPLKKELKKIDVITQAKIDKGLGFIEKLTAWYNLVNNNFIDMALLSIADYVNEFFPMYLAGASYSAAKSLIKFKGSLSQRLNLISNMSKDSKVSGENKIVLSTLHSSKGTEYDLVWICSFEEGSCPSLKNAELEEERRLAYVGITRAKKRLILSRNLEKPESTFIKELNLKPSLF